MQVAPNRFFQCQPPQRSQAQVRTIYKTMNFCRHHHTIPSESGSIRFAHLSDIHVWQPHLFTESNRPSIMRFLLQNKIRDYKQIQGYLNIKLYRGPNTYSVSILENALEKVADLNNGYQHLLITGDITNISLFDEFACVRNLLNQFYLQKRTAAGPVWSHLSIIPGNHDTYTHESVENDYFGKFFQDCLGTSLNEPNAAAVTLNDHFPNIKVLSSVRGPDTNSQAFTQHVVILGLNSGYPTKPFIARGKLGKKQIENSELLLNNTLSQLNKMDEINGDRVFKMVMIHHPPIVRRPDSKFHEYMHGLDQEDMKLFQAFCYHNNIDLVLNGHTHEAFSGWIPYENQQPKKTRSIDPGSSTYNGKESDHMARFQVYDIKDAKLASAHAMIWSPGDKTFKTKQIDLDNTQ